MQYVSRPFFFGSYLAGMLLHLPFTVGALIAGQGTIEAEHTAFVLIGSLFSIYAFIVFAVLVYKMWKITSPDFARTSPAKAVGFLFIPIFQLYWLFIAIWGWTKDFNAFLRQRQSDSQYAPEGLSLAVAIFWLIGTTIGVVSGFAGVPVVGTILGLPNLVLVPLFIYKVCSCLNDLPDEIREAALRPAMAPQEVTGPRGFGIASLVLGILSIVIPYLGLVLGIIGIVVAKKQRKICREGLSLAGLITSIIGTTLWSFMILGFIAIIVTSFYI
jgi:hypothetical protein